MRMALPTTMAYAVMNLSLLADTYFVGVLGSDAVGGVTSAGVLVGVVITLAASLAVGAEVLISRACGAGRYDDARKVLGQAFSGGLIIAALFTVAGLLFSRPLLTAMALEPAMTEMGAQYLEVVSGGLAALFLFVPATVALRASGDAVTPMKAVALATLVNVVLDPLLILGLGPIPGLGTAGAGLASVLGRAAGLAFLARRFLSPTAELRLVARYMRPRWDLILAMGKTGVFAAIMMATYDVSALVLIRVVAGFGPQMVAAYGIVMRLYMVVSLPGFGFASASSALVGQNLGAGKPERAVATARSAIYSYGAVMVAVSALLIMFALPVMRVFAREEEVALLGAWGLALFAPTFPPVVVSMTLGRSMAGAGDTLTPMFVAIVSQLLVRVPLAIVLSAVWQQTGLWAALAASNVINMVLAVYVFRRGRWRRVAPSDTLYHQ